MQDDLKLTGSHLIAGSWQVRGDDASELKARPIVEASAADVDAALRAASKAFVQAFPMSGATNAMLLRTVASELTADAAAVHQVVASETSYAPARVSAEFQRMVRQIGLFADLVEAGQHRQVTVRPGDAAGTPGGKVDLRRMHVPIGPVVVFPASNFPLAFGVMGGDSVSALAAGNPVVVKGHPSHPATSELMARCVQRAMDRTGTPSGMFGFLQSTSPAIGAALVEHPATAAVAFTGSMEVGRHLFDLAARRPCPIPVYAEMASINPVLVLPDALRTLEPMAMELADAVTTGAGQFCTKPGVILVTGNARQLVAAMASHLRAKGVMPMLGKRYCDDFAAIAASLGELPEVETVLRTRREGDSSCTAALLNVTLETFRQNPRLQHEVFGPSVILVSCPDVADALEAIEELGGQLTATLRAGAGDDPSLVRECLARMVLRCGRLVFNGVPTGVEVCEAIVHGGPYPATTAPTTSSLGTLAIERFLRPVCFQNVPELLIPAS
jgi:NADP-dependent aldehyde dehydrogenase